MKTFEKSKPIKSWDNLPMDVSRELDLIFSRSVNQVRVYGDILYVGFNTENELKRFLRKHGGRIVNTSKSQVTKIPHYVELVGWLELV